MILLYIALLQAPYAEAMTVCAAAFASADREGDSVAVRGFFRINPHTVTLGEGAPGKSQKCKVALFLPGVEFMPKAKPRVNVTVRDLEVSLERCAAFVRDGRGKSCDCIVRGTLIPGAALQRPYPGHPSAALRVDEIIPAGEFAAYVKVFRKR